MEGNKGNLKSGYRYDDRKTKKMKKPWFNTSCEEALNRKKED